MAKDQSRQERPGDLRRRAEEALSRKKTGAPPTMPEEDVRALVHELEVHQIELEMQNEELKRANALVEETRNRYVDLYELAPVGYLTLGQNGMVLEANLTAAVQLGIERSGLIKRPFQDYIVPADRDKFRSHLNKVVASKKRQSSEIRLITKSGGDFYAHLDTLFILDPSGKKLCRTTTTDITERKRAENLVNVRLSLLEFAVSHSAEELLQKTLDEIGQLTNSPIGFFHFVESDQKTLSLHAWSTRTLEEFCSAEGKGAHYPIEKAGVWVDCVHEKRPVIHNDYRALPHRKGLPDGHPPVIRELLVPIMRSDRIVAILGIGNKPEDYTQPDIGVASYVADVAWEITSRKLAEEKVKKAYQQLNATLESISDGFLSIDREWRVTYLNKSGAEMFGMKREDLVGNVIWELFPDAVNLEFYPRYHDAVESGMPVHFEEYYPSPLNKWWECHAYPSSEGLSVYFRDITEHKLIENTQVFLAECGRIASGEDFFESLARYLGQSLGMDYVCIDRLEGEGLSARTLAVYFDGKFEDNVTYTLKDTPCGEVMEKKICCFPKGVRHLFPGDAVLQEMKAESYVGTILWGSKGQAIGLIAVIGRQSLPNRHLAESILQLVAGRAAGELERKWAEVALRHSEEQYRFLFETMPNGVVFQDADGEIVSMNSAAESILGKTPAEFAGHTSTSVEYHTIREDGTPFPGLEHPSMEALRAGVEIKDIVMGVYNPHEQGYRWLDINSVPLFRAGEPRPYQVYTTFEDITDRKHMQEELRKSHDNLESRVKERTAELHQAGKRLRSLAIELLNAGENERKLIAQEIHDGLSSQLAAIKFCLERELCMERDAAQSGERLRQACTMAQDAIEETRRIMANLRPSILDDLGILPTITWLCRELHKMNTSIHPVIKFEISEEDIPAEIKTVIFRLLQEALNNIRKYSQADRVEVSLRRIGSLIVLSISDNGEGFNPKKVLSRNKIGHGFGLRGMLERVELSGGKFVIKSAPGKGVSIWAEWSIKS